MSIRIGKVSEINTTDRTVRVFFADVGIMSDWLSVIKSPPFIPSSGTEQQTETAEEHSHTVIISPWLPEIGNVVLCLYDDEFNGDGYVLGAI